MRYLLHCPRSSALACALALTALPACTGLGKVMRPEDRIDVILSLPEASEAVPDDPITVPLDDGADWIQLKSGEWLRGQVVRIRDDQLDFDSDELDDLSFDFKDLKQVRTAARQVLVTRNDQTLHGRITVKGDQIWVEGQQTVVIPRRDLLAALAFDGTSPVDWSGSINLGIAARSGNTRQVDLSSSMELMRETAQTRWLATFNGTVSRVQDTETANNHRLRTSHDVFLTERLFVTVPVVDLYRDKLQNIDYRVSTSISVGYEIVDTAKHDWRLALGPGYQHTRYDTTEPGEDRSDSTAAATVSSNYTWDITPDVDFSFDYSLVTPVPDTDEYNHNFVVKLDVDLLKDLTLNVGFVWDRVNKPIANESGVTPGPDDYRTTVGLGWSF